jgi:hypothetical protein
LEIVALDPLLAWRAQPYNFGLQRLESIDRAELIPGGSLNEGIIAKGWPTSHRLFLSNCHTDSGACENRETERLLAARRCSIRALITTQNLPRENHSLGLISDVRLELLTRID